MTSGRVAPKKKFGQHFLTAPSYAKRIAGAIPADPDARVLEIGPGKGALSIFLKARFPAFQSVEVDHDVIPALREKLGDGAWRVHQADILTFDYAQAGFPLHVAGNLPYAIGAMIIKKTFLYGNDILSATFMVQKEVARRIAAEPGTKRNGFLSIFCRFFGVPRILFHVPRGAFFPEPSVDSSVFQVRVDQHLESKLPRAEWESFFAMVSAGFAMRRKTLAGSLGRKSHKAAYAALMRDAGLEDSARAEDLGIDQWLALYRLRRSSPIP